MWLDLETLMGKVQSHMLHMDRQEWIVAFAVVIVIGSFCLRGFGSRTHY
jgi:hypothetical protein